MSAVSPKTVAESTKASSVVRIASLARAASRALARLSNQRRNEVLTAAATAIEDARTGILEANARDCRAAEPNVASGKMPAAMFARLRLSERGVDEMAARIRDVTRLPDPLGQRLAATELDEGLTLYKETCPLGVIGVVFESRPDVAVQVSSLALKSANAVILKGGTEATHTNEVLVSLWRENLRKFPDVPEDSVSLLQSRADVMELLQLEGDVDLIVPRGGRELVEFVSKNSRIPVLGHGEGICHVYVDQAADMEKAVRVTFDSKVQGPAICNAAETLLVHQAIAKEFLPTAAAKLRAAGVELRGCPRTVALLGNAETVLATDQDWATEYGDLILSVKIVDDEDEAITHINHFGSRHTDTIVTEDADAATKFMNEVDSAGVFQNASTRFADGYRYGLGAEIGISNSKLHARGPMGLEGLTTYKYKLYGNGHIVAEYASGMKKFTHRPID